MHENWSCHANTGPSTLKGGVWDVRITLPMRTGVGHGLGDGTSEAIANEGTLVEMLDPLGPSLSHCLNSEGKGTGSKCTSPDMDGRVIP